MELLELHRRAVGAWTARVAAVRPDQWHHPTPCTAWDVRQLVNHVVGEERWTVPLLRGATIEEVGSSLDGDLLGADPQAAAAFAATDALAAVAQSLPTGGTVHLSYGEETMTEYVAQLSADHLIHAWDLAAATEGERSLDPELVAEVARWFAGREELYRGAGAVGPRVEPASDDLQSMLLGATGREATWGVTTSRP